MSRRPARNQPIPLSESNLLASLDYDHAVLRTKQLFDAGWTLQAIGDAFTPPKGRSSVKAWVDRPSPPPSIHVDVPIPSPTYQTPRNGYQRKTPKSPGVPSDVQANLRVLAPVARGYRARMPAGHPIARANTEFDAVIKDLHDHYVSVADIARAAQVTHRAIARRLQK